MATDKQIDNLILNRLTKEQYESIDNPDPDQLYFVPEDEPEIHDLPSGGQTGQALVKKSNTNYDVEWQEVSSEDEIVRITYNDANVTFEDVAEMIEDGKTVICMKPQSTSHPERYYEYPLSYKYDTYIYFRTVTTVGSVQYIRLNKTGTKWQSGTDSLTQNLTPLTYDGQETSWANTATNGQMASYIDSGTFKQKVFTSEFEYEESAMTASMIAQDNTIIFNPDTPTVIYGNGEWTSDTIEFESNLNRALSTPGYFFFNYDIDSRFDFIVAYTDSGLDPIPVSQVTEEMTIYNLAINKSFVPDFSNLPLNTKLYMAYNYQPYNVLGAGGGEDNILEGVQIDGTDLSINNKKVDIPVADDENLGVIKTNSTRAVSTTDGMIHALTRTYSQYTGLNSAAFISKGTLENVINGKGLVSSEEVTKIKILTQAEYDAIVTKDANTLYFVKGE